MQLCCNRGCVVVMDCIVIGNPACTVKKDGQKVCIPLN